MNARLHVAAAVIRDGQGRILISRRATGVHQGGLWEFPGGKLESGEDVQAALRRELREELGIEAGRLSPLIRVPWDYPDRQVLLDVWEVLDFRGEPHGREGQPLRWVQPEDLAAYEFPAANRPIRIAAWLPDRYLITPEPGDMSSFLERLQRLLERGIRLAQLRAKAMETESLARLAEKAQALCEAHGARLLLNGRPDLAVAVGAAGVHLTSAQLMAAKERPLPEPFLCAASCHDPAELQRAGELGLDFAVVAPVQPTASHPEARPLGWTGFADCCDAAVLPVYALGGLGPGDVVRARAAGGQGIAAIRALWGEVE